MATNIKKVKKMKNVTVHISVHIRVFLYYLKQSLRIFVYYYIGPKCSSAWNMYGSVPLERQRDTHSKDCGIPGRWWEGDGRAATFSLRHWTAGFLKTLNLDFNTFKTLNYIHRAWSKYGLTSATLNKMDNWSNYICSKRKELEFINEYWTILKI